MGRTCSSLCDACARQGRTDAVTFIAVGRPTGQPAVSPRGAVFAQQSRSGQRFALAIATPRPRFCTPRTLVLRSAPATVPAALRSRPSKDALPAQRRTSPHCAPCMHASAPHPQAMISADQQEKLRELAESVAAGV